MIFLVKLNFAANFAAQKEKPPEISDFRGFVVAGVGLYISVK